jgi:hypothetical protein
MSHDTLSGPHHSGGGANGVLQAVAAQIREQVAAYCESTKVLDMLPGSTMTALRPQRPMG